MTVKLFGARVLFTPPHSLSFILPAGMLVLCVFVYVVILGLRKLQEKNKNEKMSLKGS